VWQAYLRRRAEKRRARKLQGRGGGSSSESGDEVEDGGGGGGVPAAGDDPFDDPFFKVGPWREAGPGCGGRARPWADWLRPGGADKSHKHGAQTLLVPSVETE
jgi:hypothetical protein